MRGAGEGGGSIEGLVGRMDAMTPGALSPDTVPSGFPSLDRVIGGGFRRQDLAILAGDVGSGKSALALGIAIRAASAGVPTLHLSGEMSPDRVMERALALEGKASVDDLRRGGLEPALRAAVGGAARRGPIPDRRSTTSAASARSSRTRMSCWRSIGRRCIARARAWRARPS